MILLPFFYIAYLMASALVILTMATLYVGFVVLIFAATILTMAIRGVFRSQWPRDPRRPSIRNRRKPGYDALGRPIQAHWSDRR